MAEKLTPKQMKDAIASSTKRSARKVDPLTPSNLKPNLGTKVGRQGAHKAKLVRVKTVSEEIAKVQAKSEKKIKQILEDSNANNITAATGNEWKSINNFIGVIETNGLGEFRNVITGKAIDLKPRTGKNKGLARVVNVTLPTGDVVNVSLQKFVALIYHPNVDGSISTRVIDGNRDNLSRENVAWSRSGRYKY